MNNSRRIRTLIDLVVYEATASEIGALKRKVDHARHFRENVLPEFCVRDDNNNVTRSDYYLQWIENGEDKYFLFDAVTTDMLLSEEISFGGFDGLVKDIDFRKVLLDFRKEKLDEKYRRLRESEYLIIDLIYTGHGEDTELNVEVIGKLNLNNSED